MQYTVRIFRNGDICEKKVEKGTNLLQFLYDNSVRLNTPCGGNGRCGKCRVVVKGLAGEPSIREKRLLGEKALKNGYRLACCNSIDSDIDIYLDECEEKAVIMSEARERDMKLNPVVTKKYVELDAPGIHDQAPDLERVIKAWEGIGEVNNLELLRTLPATVRENGFKITLVRCGNELIAAEPGNTCENLYGIAVDIGTTTIAAYLYDLNSGRKLDVHSLLNPQRKFGADVLSRIDYSMKSEAALEEVHNEIIRCINGIVYHFARKNGIQKDNIYACVLVGNTIMMHFAMKLSPGNIAVSPFIPVTSSRHTFKASELGIDINRSGRVIAFPSVSGYIGADVVAGVLACGMHEDEKVSLLVDIGTNGEMVLGNRHWLYACSTAAGPAFEGANIRNGVGGIKGAIDSAIFGDELELTTIGGGKAIGICGSGIVDIVAGMLEKGIIDETGRIASGSEAKSLPKGYAERLKEIDGVKSFLLYDSDECEAGMDIAITQKDIRELQNAKAAIAAGIKTLAKHAGIRLEDVEKVYLAGGFGNYINIESALTIGLLPRELKGRVEAVGNSAGAGASAGLLSYEFLQEADKVKNRIRYIELSANADFVNEYVENMLF